MSAYSRWYLDPVDVGPTSLTIKGTWFGATMGNDIRRIRHCKAQSIGEIGNADLSGGGTGNPFFDGTRYGLHRFRTLPLDTQVTGGTLQITLGAGALPVYPVVPPQVTGGSVYWAVYAYVTEGDHDTNVRGVLLDYEDTGGTAFTDIHTFRSFVSPQALSSVTIQAGDRIVIEIGFVIVGTPLLPDDQVDVGMGFGLGSTVGASDAVTGATNTAVNANHIDFSQALILPTIPSFEDPCPVQPLVSVAPPLAPQTPCTPAAQIGSGGKGNSGCTVGGIGRTPTYGGPYGTVANHADPVDGELLTDKETQGVEPWLELIHVDDPSVVQTIYRRAFVELGDPSTFEGGRKPRALISLGSVQNSLGNEQGMQEASSVDAVLSDADDRLIRILMSTQDLEGDEVRVKLASDTLRNA